MGIYYIRSVLGATAVPVVVVAGVGWWAPLPNDKTLSVNANGL